jgi:protein KRI1
MKFFEEDDNVELEFGFNKEYASRFEHNKKRQELEQLQAKYKNMSDSESDSSSSEEEDENGELITEEIDDQIALTLKFLRQKDEIVYTDKNFFDDQELAQIKKKEKPVYLKEYQQSILLGKRESPNKFENNEKIQLDVEVDDEELFTKRELEQSDQEVDDDQFLDNFLKKKQWIQTDLVQTYDQITHTLHDTTDEEEESDHENYETTHNFRFEEPNSNMVITHSRLISGAIRRKDNTRVLKRMTLKERKEQEKTKKQNELKRLKNLKKMELNEKLKEIHKMAGGDLKGLDSIDLEKEFDPNEHDRKMMGMFDQKYYQHCNDAVKPVFDDDIDILDLVDEEDTGEGGDYAEDYPAGNEKDYTGYEDKKSKKIVFDENMDADAEQQVFNINRTHSITLIKSWTNTIN